MCGALTVRVAVECSRSGLGELGAATMVRAHTQLFLWLQDPVSSTELSTDWV